jgi:Icc-related predicted phosphoesterase
LIILAITDVHDLPGFENVIRMIDEVKPDLLLSCGDWGSNLPNEKHPTKLEGFKPLQYETLFVPILNKVPMYTLYGNHDVLDVLENLINSSKTKCLIPDIKPIWFNGVKIVGINGNYAWKKRMPWHKTFYDLEHFNDLLEFSDKLKEKFKDLDILMTHEQPTTIPKTKKLGQPILTQIAAKLKPKIHLSGHVHHAAKYFDGTTVFANLGMCLKGDYGVINTTIKPLDVKLFNLEHGDKEIA